MTYKASPKRYSNMNYVRCGRSGLKMPLLSLGLWHNFGDVDDFIKGKEMLLHAFDAGITHFDLANNYGPPPGSAESNFGKIMRSDLAPYRDELVISTKAGYLMWPGPYGEWGSRKYLLASLNQSLKRMGLKYVDIFYSHRLDPETRLEETMGALNTAVKTGRALYAGISNYPPEETDRAVALLKEMNCPFIIHQEKFSILKPKANEGLDKVLKRQGIGCIAFSPLAQGILTDRYIDGIPGDSRAAKSHGFLKKEEMTDDVMTVVRNLRSLASEWGITTSELALNWVRSHDFITSVLVGVSSIDQLNANLKLIDMEPFSPDQMDEISKICSILK